MARRVRAIPGISRHVFATHYAFAMKCRREGLGVARSRETNRVKQRGAAFLIDGPIGEPSALRAYQRRGNIGYLLHELLQVQLRRKPRTNAVEQLGGPASFVLTGEKRGAFLFSELSISNVPGYFRCTDNLTRRIADR